MQLSLCNAVPFQILVNFYQHSSDSVFSKYTYKHLWGRTVKLTLTYIASMPGTGLNVGSFGLNAEDFSLNAEGKQTFSIPIQYD